ncbi:MAG: 16S rRNA (guanine(527)-N(7))-methyltransferase RsmG [Candidatus Acidiferrales bacterium]|jgi:16S rRNA (guanine527-N7)-methyltransferase
MKHLSDAQIAEILRPYGVSANVGLCNRVRTYIAILLKWNATVSLTAVIEPVEICRFHFGESIFAASAVPMREGRLADVGSGAGFPGLPLRMASPAITLTLIESNARKAAFLSEVVRSLELKGVEVFRGRMEDHKPDKPYDWVTARALGQHDDLLRWAKGNLTASGKVVLWVGEDDANRISQTPEWEWRPPILIPGSKRRFLLVGSTK